MNGSPDTPAISRNSSSGMSGQPSVAIIGAGMAGLTCGTALKGLVENVKIFEKSVFPGGRVSRIRSGEYEFNHGAQYFTVNNPLFWNIVSAWQTVSCVPGTAGSSNCKRARSSTATWPRSAS